MDSVTWMKDGVEITGDNLDFSQSQMITDRSSATYQHTLFVLDALHFVGKFTCIVRDVVGNKDARDLTSEDFICSPLSFIITVCSIMQLVLWVTTFHELVTATQCVYLVQATASLLLRAVRCASVCVDTTGVHRRTSMSPAPVSL